MMKKILIIGEDNSGKAVLHHLKQLAHEQNEIELFKTDYSELEPIADFNETKSYDKPKSKFHK